MRCWFFWVLDPGLLATFSASAHIILSLFLITILVIVYHYRIFHGDITWFLPSYFLVSLYFGALLIGHSIIEPDTFVKSLNLFLISQIGLLYIFVVTNSFGIKYILKTIIYIMFFLGMSYSVYWISKFLGLSSALLVKKFQIPGYDGLQSFYFPFSIFYQQKYYLFGLDLPRAIGIFREPGVYQAFAASSILMLDFVGFTKKKKFVFSVVIGVGFLSSLSTAAIVTMASLAAYFMFRLASGRGFKYKAIAVIFGVLACVIIFLLGSLNSVGIVSKLEGKSGQVRYLSIVKALEYGTKHPLFGTGLNTDKRVMEKGWGVPNFIASIGATGVVAFLLYAIFLSYVTMKNFKNKSLQIILPFIITMLTSQPIFYSISVIGLCILPFEKISSRDAVIW